MWMAFLIGGAFFAAIVAIGYFGIQQGGDPLEEGAPLAAPGDGEDGSCGLCSAPLRRAATSDQAVFEIEHRIHADLKDVTHALRAHPDPLRGILA